jgi:hypothetical protein
MCRRGGTSAVIGEELSLAALRYIGDDVRIPTGQELERLAVEAMEEGLVRDETFQRFAVTRYIQPGKVVNVLLEHSTQGLLVMGDRGLGDGRDAELAIRSVVRMLAGCATCGLVIVPASCCASQKSCPGCWYATRCPGVPNVA